MRVFCSAPGCQIYKCKRSISELAISIKCWTSSREAVNTEFLWSQYAWHDEGILHQRLAASTWWCGPRPSLEKYAEMDNDPERPDHPVSPNRLEIRPLATLCGSEIFLTALSLARFLRFPRMNCPFPVLSAVNCLDFAATVTAFSCPQPMQDKTEGEFLQRLRTISAGSDSPHSDLSCIWASLACALSLALFLPFLTSGPDLRPGPTVGFPWSSSTPPSIGRGRVVPPPPRGNRTQIFRLWGVFFKTLCHSSFYKVLRNFNSHFK